VVARELLQSQIEVATPPCQSMAQARALLAGYRRTLGSLAAERGLGLIAAGTHPAALWSRQKSTDAARYDRLMKDLQMLGARNMVCGLHVHVGLPDPSRRVSILTRMTPFLPLLLALSASSPFWQGRPTGLMAYRLAAYDELPRTGVPDAFESATEYERYIDILVAAGAIPDSSFVWWATRGPRRRIRRSSCASPTPAPGSTMRWRSPRCSARWCAASIATTGSTPAAAR
jgi:carboxylate-amine ligase